MADSVQESIDKFRKLAGPAGARDIVLAPKRQPLLGWQFTGQGSQFPGMGRQLYERFERFRRVIDQCDDLLSSWRAGEPDLAGEPSSLCDVMFAGDDDPRIHNTLWTQPCLFALHWGLADLWASWGARPDFVFGHSVGQFAAACVAGMMSWEDGLRLIAHRGRLISELPGGGRMLAVFSSLASVENYLRDLPELSLAAANGSHQVVSGPQAAIDRFMERLADDAIRCKPLVTSHAFHSSLMEPVLPEFAAYADNFQFAPPSGPALICNITGRVWEDGKVATGQYWADHIRQPVMYAPSVATLAEAGCKVLVELGPRSVLTSMAAGVGAIPGAGLISTLQRGVAEGDAIMSAAAGVYVQRGALELAKLNAGQGGQQIALPTYPFQRRRFWGPDKPRAAHAADHTRHPLLGGRLELAGTQDEIRYENHVDRDSPAWMADHQVMDQITFPGAGWIEMALAAEPRGEWFDIVFERPLLLAERTELQTVIRKAEEYEQKEPPAEALDAVAMDGAALDAGVTDRQNSTAEQKFRPSKTLECWSRSADGQGTWRRHARAQHRDNVPATGNSPALQATDLIQQLGGSAAEHDVDQFYQKLRDMGLDYGPAFRTVARLWSDETSVLAELKMGTDALGYHVAPPLLDGALHSLACQLFGQADAQINHLYLPVGIGSIRMLGQSGEAAWCVARWTELAESTDGRATDTGSSSGATGVEAEGSGGPVEPVTNSAEGEQEFRAADLILYNAEAEPILELKQLRVQRVSLEQLRPAHAASKRNLVYGIDWVSAQPGEKSVCQRRWLIVDAGEQTPLATELARSLVADQCEVGLLQLSGADFSGPATTRTGTGWEQKDEIWYGRQSVQTPEQWQQVLQSLRGAWSVPGTEPKIAGDNTAAKAPVGDASQNDWLAGITWVADQSTAGRNNHGELLENGIPGQTDASLQQAEKSVRPLLGLMHALAGEQTSTSKPPGPVESSDDPGTAAPPSRKQSASGAWQLECGLQFLTQGAIDSGDIAGLGDGSQHTEGLPAEPVDPFQTMLWGLGRVVSAEFPQLRCRLIDFALPQQQEVTDSTDEPCRHQAAELAGLLLTETEDNEFVWQSIGWKVPRLKPRVAGEGDGSLTIREDGAYLISGGLGSLGRRAAEWLSAAGAGEVVLVSRRAADEQTQEWIDALNEAAEASCKVSLVSTDLSDAGAVRALLAQFDGSRMPLRGVVHAAGVLDDGLLEEQTWERFENVLRPKLVGSLLLDQLTRDRELDFFALYSSAASVLGSPGQSNYALANAFMDGLAWSRVAAGVPGTSLNWGPWAEGMAADERVRRRMELQGVRAIESEEAHRVLDQLLSNGTAQATVIDVDWRRMRSGMGGQLPPMLAELAPQATAASLQNSQLVAQLLQLSGSARQELLHRSISELLHQVLGSNDALDADRPLVEMGLDSLMAVELSTGLQEMLGDGFQIAPTMLFDHPSLNAITEFVLSQMPDPQAGTGETKPADEMASAKIVTDGSRELAAPTERQPIAIIGLSCRFPGAADSDEFWQNLLAGVDSVRPIPNDRWDIDRFFSESGEPGKMNTREGGFLPDIAEFDAGFFNISPQEACWIDPQHRMLLEQSYLALEDAGLDIPQLRSASVGVFMGIMGQDYAFLPTLDDEDVVRAFQGAGLSHSAGVGRISYTFGFEGPSLAIDTASSSSLVALLQAARSLQDGQCDMALAGAANAILAPVNSLLMSQSGLLAPDGRCKSFSAAADGFGRGEGCGVVVLKRLSDAQRDGDLIRAVLRGGAIAHNGASSAITAPNSKSQTRVIESALRDSGMSPSEVQYLEAHGTGTQFGDPMELTAAAKVYARGRGRDKPLLVGSVKANIGHLEAAGGMSGLIKVILSMQHGTLPGQIHFDEPNPHIPWKRLPLEVVRQNQAWPLEGDPGAGRRTAAITALGLVGTNAHVILESAEADTSNSGVHGQSKDEIIGPAQASFVLPISGRSPQAVADLASRYRGMLQQLVSDVERGVSEEFRLGEYLRDICHTAATCRSHLEHRAVAVFGNIGEAITKLDSIWEACAVQSGAGVGESHSAANGSSNGAIGRAALSWVSPGAGVYLSPAAGSPGTKLAWYFDGGGAESNVSTIDLEILRNEPTLVENLASLNDRLQTHCRARGLASPPSLACILDSPGSADDINSSDSALNAFVLQLCFAKLWRRWGIEPDEVSGIGLGQVLAAWVAGGIDEQDAVVLAYERQRTRNSIANSATEDNQVALLDEFEKFADTLNFYPPNMPLVCGLSGDVVPIHRALAGSFWREHCQAEAGAFESESHLQKLNEKLTANLLLSFDEAGCELKNLNENRASGTNPLFRRSGGRQPDGSLAEVLARIYVSGIKPRFSGIGLVAGNRMGLPGYPFQRQRYWITEIADHQVGGENPADRMHGAIDSNGS